MDKNNKITFINIIFLIIILFILCFVINYLHELNNFYILNNENTHIKYKNKLNFDDLTKISTNNKTPQEIKVLSKDETIKDSIEGCNAGTDVYGYCLKYDNCCSGTMKNSCFCKNPIVLSCKKEYDKCMTTPNLSKSELLATCADKNKACCSEYKNNIIDNTNFTSVIGEQKDNIICNIINISNIDAKCSELCQTDPSCVAYTLSDLNCNLHDKITYKPSQNKDANTLINNNYKFFTKKII